MNHRVLALVKKVQQSMDMTQFQRFENNITESKKLKKMKDLENSSRCHSARNRHRSKTSETSRTRSVSPTPLLRSFKASLSLEKFYNIHSKILLQLETVYKLTETKENDCENFLDLRRQIQRADEFSIRFSRNNLYETKRIVNEIKKLVPRPFENLTVKESKALSKKIILAFQASSQALQTYINYIKNPSNLEIPDKINELILLIADLFLCCENVCLSCEEINIQKDAVKLCNDLLGVLKTKVPVCDYVEIKQADLVKKPMKPFAEDIQNMKRLSMYKSKLSNAPLKAKETLKKKVGLACLLGNKARKLKKKDEKARITHEIYTQKLNPAQGKGLGSKIVKFDSGKVIMDEKIENSRDKNKQGLRRCRTFTPREVRAPDDDDVETMVQAIRDEDVTTKLESVSRESDEASNASSNLNRSSFRELLLEAIEELQNSDKKEQKATLKKLLTSIQNCSKSENPSPRLPKVKVYHFKSKDLEEAEYIEKLGKKEGERVTKIDLETLHKEQKAKEAILSKERELKSMFKPLKPRKAEKDESGVVPRGKIKLRIPEDTMKSINKYKKAFGEYKKANIMYKKNMAIAPWELLGKISDTIILDLIKDISQDLQNDIILQRLYYNELLEISR